MIGPLKVLSRPSTLRTGSINSSGSPWHNSSLWITPVVQAILACPRFLTTQETSLPSSLPSPCSLACPVYQWDVPSECNSVMRAWSGCAYLLYNCSGWIVLKPELVPWPTGLPTWPYGQGDLWSSSMWITGICFAGIGWTRHDCNQL